MIPQILQDITQYLIESHISFSKEFGDGRLNSAKNENGILTIISHRFNIRYAKSKGVV